MASQSNRPSDSILWQQKYSGFRPIYSPLPTALILLVASIIFLCLGGPILHEAMQLSEYSVRYDNVPGCSTASSCSFSIEVTDSMTGPVYLYYEMRNFYQNHLQFVKTRDYPQLAGTVESQSQVNSKCGDVTQVKNLMPYAMDMNPDLSPDDVANPCGLSSKYFFTDQFSIAKDNMTAVAISESGIAWTTDIDYIYSTPSDTNLTWLNVDDEHFMVWMKTAPRTTFRKLWGVIHSDLAAGDYTVEVTSYYNNSNTTFDVSQWSGEKHVVLATANSLGGKAYALPIAFIVAGSVTFVAAAAILVLSKFKKDETLETVRNFNDPSSVAEAR